MNRLYYGDNLSILRNEVETESVDLVYLDPPFNSNRTYNVLFKSPSGEESAAQVKAFGDTWKWSNEVDAGFQDLIGGGAPPSVADSIIAMRQMLSTSDTMAYLVMMAPRLIELQRVMKRTGVLYLHCDPTASHYLKVLMDRVFGPENFRNEIIWCYAGGGIPTKDFPRKHDVILRYTKSNTYFYQPIYRPYSDGTVQRGRTQVKGKYFDEGLREEGTPVNDWWPNVKRITSPTDPERLGYPTQKSVDLLLRIIESSSRTGDVVLDPFCGCGTTIDAAERAKRKWVGIDIAYLAMDLIRRRLEHVYGKQVAKTYQVSGIPNDIDGADALFARNPFEFERWAVSLVDGFVNDKQVGDKGADGRIRFHASKDRVGSIIISVKGGGSINPGMVRDLVGTVSQERAEMGLLLTMAEVTRGMTEVAAKAGTYKAELTGQAYPKIQILTIKQLLVGTSPRLPPAILPYVKAAQKPGEQLGLRPVNDEIEGLTGEEVTRKINETKKRPKMK